MLLENYEENITQGQFDPESMAITNVTLKETIDDADEQEKKIIAMLAEGLNQSEIASRLGISQSAVSKKIGQIKNKISSTCENY